MIGIGLAGDHQLLRMGLRQLLAQHQDMQIVFDAGSEQLFDALGRLGPPHLLLFDLSLPGCSGVELLRRLHARWPQLPVLMLSLGIDPPQAITLLRQGAAGYVSSGGDAAEIAQAVRTVARGRRYITGAIAELLAATLSHPGQPLLHELLSEREFQVFLRLAEGRTLTQVAAGMALSVKTVSTYRTRVMEKMGLQSNSDLTYYALKHGLRQ